MAVKGATAKTVIIEKLKSENFIELKKEITLINMRCMHLVKL